jgi:hypothetical protein
MSQEKKKPVRFITNVEIKHVSDSHHRTNLGYSNADDYFVLDFESVVDSEGHLRAADRYTSSRIVRVDIIKGEFETSNSLYKVIPTNLVDVYRMTDTTPAWDPTDPKAQWPHPLAPKSTQP